MEYNKKNGTIFGTVFLLLWKKGKEENNKIVF